MPTVDLMDARTAAASWHAVYFAGPSRKKPVVELQSCDF